MSADQGESSGAMANGISAADAEAAMAALSKNPKFQSILQKHMNNMSAQSAYESLPAAVKNRVRCLKNIQVDLYKLEAQFYQEVQKLEAKYQSLYQPLLDKRAEVVTGKYEPTEDECKWTLDDEEDEDEEDDKPVSPKKGKGTQQASGGQAQALTNGKEKEEEEEESVNGIPEFWLTALKNTDIFADMIFDHDEPILKHLTDIKVSYPDEKGMNFTLEFHFSENDYFTNKVLTKSYTMSCDVPEDDPFSFEGASIISCTGCKIDWKKGKNVTVKTIRKKQKHKGKGQSRVITKTVPNDSFFGFFTPPDPEALKEAEDDDDAEEITMKLEADFARAEFLRDRMLLKAVLFYTGEAIEDEDEDLSEEDGDDDDDDDDGEDDAQDEDYNAESDLNKVQPPECKQQ